MTKPLVALAFLSLAMIANASADLTAYEGFEYPAGPLEARLATGGSGWAGGWSGIRNLSISGDERSLAFPPGVKANPTGSRLEQSGEAFAVRELSPEVFDALNSNGGSLYVAVLAAKETKSAGNAFLTFSLVCPNPARPIVSFGITSNDTLRVGLFSKEGAVGGTYTTPVACLLVAKLERTAERLIAKLWVFDANTPVPATEPEPNLQTSEAIPFEWKQVLFRIEQGQNAAGQVDEIRFLKDWNGVAGEPRQGAL